MCPVATSIALASVLAVSSQLDAELAKFPPKYVVDSYVRFNKAHMYWLASQRRLCPGSEKLRDWLNDCLNCGCDWELLQVAQDSGHKLDIRQEMLRILKGSLGDEAYFQGHLPPPVPIWRFIEGKPPASPLLPNGCPV
jgi:hypothetical protein